VRSELEINHRDILALDHDKLFDEKAILSAAKEGDIAVDNTNPFFLVFVSGVAGRRKDEIIGCAVRQGAHEAMKFAWERSSGFGGFTMFEIVTSAHVLRYRLGNTEPSGRGRGA
jgi:hypothetical protein